MAPPSSIADALFALIEFTEGARTLLAYNAPFEQGCVRA